MPPNATAVTASSAKPTRNTSPRPRARSPKKTDSRGEDLTPLVSGPFLFHSRLKQGRLGLLGRFGRLLRALASLWSFAECCALRRRQGRPRPRRQFLRIVVKPRRQLPIGADRDGLGSGLILKRFCTLDLEARDAVFVGAQVKPAAERQREVGSIGGNPESGEHPADGHRTEIGKQINQEIAVHGSYSAKQSKTVIPGRCEASNYDMQLHIGESRDSGSGADAPSRNDQVLFAFRATEEPSTLHLRRRQLHGFPATAGAGLIWIVEDELGLQLVGLVVHLGAEQEQHGFGINEDLHTLVLDD